MIVSFSQSVSKIIKDTIAQCSQDFRGLRTQKLDMDIIFDDFVMTEDDKPSLTNELENISVFIYQNLKAYTLVWSFYQGEIDIELESSSNASIVTPIMLNIYIYALLAWWYETRLPDLSLSYRTKMDAQMSALISAVAPKFAERRLRMF